MKNYKYATYIRKSTLGQVYARQIKQLKDFCKAQNIDFNSVEIYTETQSGKNFNRPVLEKLLNKLDDTYCLLLVECTRLGRTYDKTKELFAELNRKNVAFVVTTNPMIDTRHAETEPCKKLIADIVLLLFTWIADEEYRTLQERTNAGREAYIADGGKLGRPQINKDNIPDEVIKTLKKYSDLPKVKQLTLINDELKKANKKTISRQTLYSYLKLLEV